MMVSQTERRLLGLYACFVGALGLLWARCAWLQIVQAPRLGRLADAQHQVSQPLVAPRGTVYDRHGHVLAMSVRVPSVFASPRSMTHKALVAGRVANVLQMDSTFVEARLQRDKGFVWLARHASPELVDDLRPLRRQGIGWVEESRRLYPNGPMAGHVLGFVDIDQRGLEGLELALDGVLRGRPGWRSTMRDATGDLLIGPWTQHVEPQAGHTVITTIDSVVQGIAEEALAWGVDKFHAKGGSVIVMDPHSGEILAMANQPGFDPNHAGRAPLEARRNRAITDLMEPGSIFKIVAASALLEEGAVRPDERFFCEEGAYRTVARHILHDHRPHGWLTFHDVIKFSSNIGTAKAAQRLTPDQLYRYIRAFGFGQRTGIELVGEVSGIVHPPSAWSKLSPFIIPIGQEVAVTPVQLAVMTSIVANGGWVVRPSIVQDIQTADGRSLRRDDPPTPERLLHAETIDQLQTILTSVVESGTGRLANLQGLVVAGKTGTAQKLEPDGRYSHSRYIASFVGFGPVPDSRFAIVVSVDEPRPLYFGGVVAAPIFRRVVERLAGYWELTPSAPAQQLARLR